MGSIKAKKVSYEVQSIYVKLISENLNKLVPDHRHENYSLEETLAFIAMCPLTLPRTPESKRRNGICERSHMEALILAEHLAIQKDAIIKRSRKNCFKRFLLTYKKALCF